MRDAGSQSIPQSCPNPSLGDITMGHQDAWCTVCILYMQYMHLRLPLHQCQLHSPSCHLILIDVTRLSLRPWLCLLMAMAMTDISRYMKHEGSLSNNFCLPGRLQDKVPQAVHTLHTAGQPFGLSCFLP